MALNVNAIFNRPNGYTPKVYYYSNENYETKAIDIKILPMALPLLGVLVAFLFTSTIITSRNKTEKQSFKPAAAYIATAPTPTVTQPPVERHPNLKEIVDKEIANKKGSFGIIIKNLKTEESYSLNDHQVFESASLYKLWIMALAYKQIKDGKLSEEESVSQDAGALYHTYNISSDEGDIQGGIVQFTVHDALDKMITVSDNTAALLLSDRVGFSNVKEFLKNNHFDDSSFSQPPKTTPADIAKFLETLYKGQLASEEYTTKMLTLLKNQRLNGKLPKYLPEESVVAHKTGELDTFTHDAGIILSEKGDYIVVILTKSEYPPDAVETIAQVSKAVYQYFENSP